MPTTNVFLNSYQQPENKLTYSFLCLLEHLNVSATALLEKIGVLSSPVAPIQVNLLYGGGLTNPDGSILVTEHERTLSIFFENKTYRRGLNLEQIQGHLKQLTPNDLLLVITSDRSDRDAIYSIGDERLRFSTWPDVANAVHELGRDASTPDDRLLLSQFEEYLEKSGEAWRARMLDKRLIDSFSETLRRQKDAADFVAQASKLISAIKDDLCACFSNEMTAEPVLQRYGRITSDCELITSPFGQTVGFGVYCQPDSRTISLKTEFQPEFAVFYYIPPENRGKLAAVNGIKAAAEELNKAAFEFCFPEIGFGSASRNWQVCLWRDPMVNRIGSATSDIRQMFEDRLRVLFKSRFYQLAKNCKA
jgi:hypothetical protein